MNRHISAEDLAERMDHARRSGAGYVARCPAHADNHASLSISNGRRGVVLFCHAACMLDDILVEIGITKEQLFYDYAEKPDRGNGPDINQIMRALVKAHEPPPLRDSPVLEEVMWDALTTDHLERDVWAENAARTGIAWRWLMRLPYTEAMRYHVIVGDGPLFDFLFPLWVLLDRPDWSKIKGLAFTKMHKVYREQLT